MKQLYNKSKYLTVSVQVGVEPDLALATSSKLEVDPVHGGFKVNAELEARTKLYVAFERKTLSTLL